MRSIITKSGRATKAVAGRLAKDLVVSSGRCACVVALEGVLGAGKTTFAQGFARALGIKERVLSPTFVIVKIYAVQKRIWTRHFVHIDCYRMRSSRDLASLGIKEIFKDKKAIVLIEWPERIRRLIPKNALCVRFRHGKKENERILSFQIPNNKSQITNKFK